MHLLSPLLNAYLQSTSSKELGCWLRLKRLRPKELGLIYTSELECELMKLGLRLTVEGRYNGMRLGEN